MMRELRLYGVIGERFGRVHCYDIDSPLEAFRALEANNPGALAWLQEHVGYFRMWVGAERRSEQTMSDPGAGIIRIAPVISGAEPATLTAIGVFITAGLATGATAAVIGFIAVNLALSLVLGAISGAIFGSPSAPDVRESERPENRPNYSYDGPVNTIAQGHAVPIYYGDGSIPIGSATISAGLSLTPV